MSKAPAVSKMRRTIGEKPKSKSIQKEDQPKVKVEEAKPPPNFDDISLFAVGLKPKRKKSIIKKKEKRTIVECGMQQVTIVPEPKDPLPPLPSDPYFPFELKNIMAINAPFLKEYFYEMMNFEGINDVFLNIQPGEEKFIFCCLPSLPVGFCPYKVLFHLQNLNIEDNNWTLERKQACDCEKKTVQVGISISKKVFNCPHRQLLTITPTSGRVKHGEIFTWTIKIENCVLGCNQIHYILKAKEATIHFFFVFYLIEFHILNMIVTTELFPIDIAENYFPTQPIWVLNPYKQDMKLRIDCCAPELEIIDPILMIKSGELSPFLVKFKPHEIKLYEFTIYVSFVCNCQSHSPDSSCICQYANPYFTLRANCIQNILLVPSQAAPKIDVVCSESLFVIFRNFIGCYLKQGGYTEKLIMFHNKSNMCIQINWIRNTIPNYYDIVVHPESKIVPGNHTVTFSVKITSGNYPCIFYRIPLKCNIYKYHMECLPVPEPKGHFIITEDGYRDLLPKKNVYRTDWITSLYINVNIRVIAMNSLDRFLTTKQQKELNPTLTCYCGTDKTNVTPRRIKVPEDIVDQLFWSILNSKVFKHDLQRKHFCLPDYQQVVSIVQHGQEKATERPNKRRIMDIMDTLLKDTIRDIYKEHRFVPHPNLI